MLGEDLHDADLVKFLEEDPNFAYYFRNFPPAAAPSLVVNSSMPSLFRFIDHNTNFISAKPKRACPGLDDPND